MIVVTRGYGPGASEPAVVRRGYISASTAALFNLQPVSDDFAGGWTPVGAATLSGAINELVPNDANYIQSSTNPSFDVCEVKLNSINFNASQPMNLSYRVAQDNTSQKLNLTTTLLQGGTIIAVWSNDLGSAIFTTFTQTLTPAQVAAITDPSSLHLQFDANTPNTDTLALLLTSQLGPAADNTHTVYNQPWLRVTSGGAWVAGDTLLLTINTIDNNSKVLSATDVARGYFDIQITPALAAGVYSIQSCIIRGGKRNGLSAPTSLTIFPYAYDGIATPYAIHGARRQLTSYSGPLIQIRRADLSQTIDMLPQIDGYIDGSLVRMLCRNNPNGGLVDGSQVILKVYDQTGHGRDAVLFDNTQKPWLNLTANSGGGVFPDWGWRGQLYIQETGLGTTLTETLAVSNMGGVAQAVSGLTVIGQFGFFGGGQNSNGFDRAAFSISAHGGTNRRAFVSSHGLFNGQSNAGGRRQDADSEVITGQLGQSSTWSPFIAAYDYANAILTYTAYGATVTANPFETAGITDNTTSDSVTIGGSSRGDSYNGGVMDVAWFQRVLNATEIAAITSPQFLYSNIPHRPLIRVGVTLEMEAFRQALINKLFVSTPGFPTGGFDTTDSNHTDPLASIGFSPVNLDHFDHHTINTKDQNGNQVASFDVGVWFPSSGTTNNKLMIYYMGIENYPPNSAGAQSFNDHIVIKTMVEAGYTVAEVGYPSNPNTLLNTEPTANLTPYRYFIEGVIKTINALQGSFAAGKIMVYGFSFGSGPVCVAAAIDPRISAVIAHDQVQPLSAAPSGADFLVGIIDMNAQTGCDFPDLWLLALTGSTITRSVYLSFSNTQLINQGNSAEWFTPSLQISQIYRDRGVFGTFFDTAFPQHGNGPGAQALMQTIFGRY